MVSGSAASVRGRLNTSARVRIGANNPRMRFKSSTEWAVFVFALGGRWKLIGFASVCGQFLLVKSNWIQNEFFYWLHVMFIMGVLTFFS